jgi:hypothetical protein
MPVERCLASSVVAKGGDGAKSEALEDEHSLPDVAPGFVLPRAQSRPRKRGSAPWQARSTRLMLACIELVEMLRAGPFDFPRPYRFSLADC